jgi:hypothetical protein
VTTPLPAALLILRDITVAMEMFTEPLPSNRSVPASAISPLWRQDKLYSIEILNTHEKLIIKTTCPNRHHSEKLQSLLGLESIAQAKMADLQSVPGHRYRGDSCKQS